MTLAPVRISEAADSMAKASTPEPFSSSKTSNWVARGGGLPAYIQHIAHDLMEKRGKSESEAIGMAVGIVKRWARGGGKVDSGTRAAASKAVAEWEKLKAGNAAKSAVKESFAGELTVRDAALERVAVWEAVVGLDGMVGMLAEGALAEAQQDASVQRVAEGLRFDLLTVAGLDIPPLRRVQEARRRDPFELVSEAFHPDELRGFGGKWIAGGARHARLTPRSVTPGRARAREVSAAAHRYEGGVVRASARLRAAHAAKPQIAKASDKKPELAMAASIGEGRWSKSAGAVSKRLISQREMNADEIAKGVKAGTAIDTETAHRTGPAGEFSKERQALHQQIIDNLLQGKGSHHGKARAIFTAGGGASGKSAMIKAGVVKVPHDAVLANPDIVREMLPEYKALKAAGREDAASLTHEESSLITKRLTRIALARQHHVLVDGVGDSGPKKFAGKIKAAQAAGHKVSVHYATVPIAEAIRRSDQRGLETRRFVDHGVLRTAHAAVSQRFGEVSKIPGVHVQVFHTGQGTREAPKPPKLLYEHHTKPDNMSIKDRSDFRDFLDKAKGGG